MDIEPEEAKLAVCITTYMTDYDRREGPGFQVHLEFYKWAIDRYLTAYHGIRSVDILILDSGSEDASYWTWLKEILATHKNVHLLKVKNKCAYLAGMKGLFDEHWDFIQKYDYFLFHPDDAVEPNEPKWAVDLLEHIPKHDLPYILGFFDNVNIYVDLSKAKNSHWQYMKYIWGDYWESRNSIVRLIHGLLYLMDLRTLSYLKDYWEKPYPDHEQVMSELLALENTDYATLRQQNRKMSFGLAASEIDIIREHELMGRLLRMNVDIGHYMGTRLRILQLNERECEWMTEQEHQNII